MGYSIRPAQSTELPQLPAIEHAAALNFRDSPYPWIVDDDVMSLSDLAQDFARGQVWVAADETGALVGFAVAYPVDDTGYLRELAVMPAHGRRGIGTQLIDALCDWAQSSGLRAVTLSTFRNVAWNMPYYAKLGFRELSDNELSPGLLIERANEASWGLPMDQRVCMRLELEADQTNRSTTSSLNS